MSHDPLCFVREKSQPLGSCECDFIAKIRADERERAAQRVETQRSSFRARDWDDAIAAAAAAARGEA